MTRLGWLLVTAAVLAGSGESCVYLYGSRHEAAQSKLHYTYGYIGLDWPEEFPTCSGAHQSPIHVPGHSALSRLSAADASIFNYGKLSSDGSNILIINNGHTVQVKLPAEYKPEASVVYSGAAASATLTSKFDAAATSARTRVKISPAQFHFHTRSEHVISGKEYPLEMHIVNFVYNDTLPACGAGGCITVVGIMFELDESDTATNSSFLDTVFSAMPLDEGTNVTLPSDVTLDFDAVLPADRSYITYEGSLTTPPCTEGILWHVLTTPVKITKKQLHQFQLAVGETECPDTPSPATAESAKSAAQVSASKVSLLQASDKIDAPKTPINISDMGSRSADLQEVTNGTSDAQQPATELDFVVPDLAEDPVDHLMCHKLSGQNYREVQDLKQRPIWFYAAQGVCDQQLQTMSGRSRVVHDLLYPSNNNTTMTLSQYDEIVAANLTTAAGCAGAVSSSSESKYGAAGWLQQSMVGAAMIAAMLIL